MSVLKNDNNLIVIDKDKALILESKIEDGSELISVTYKNSDTEIYIGTYCSYNYAGRVQYLEYNNNLIVILERTSNEPLVKVMFDIKTELFIVGNEEDLRDYYKMELKKNSKNIEFNKMLFIKKAE